MDPFLKIQADILGTLKRQHDNLKCYVVRYNSFYRLRDLIAEFERCYRNEHEFGQKIKGALKPDKI